MNELTLQLSRRAGIDVGQADLAISIVIEFLSRRLASPAVGEIRMLLERPDGAQPGAGDVRQPERQWR